MNLCKDGQPNPVTPDWCRPEPPSSGTCVCDCCCRTDDAQAWAKHTTEVTDMVFIWINEGDGWEPHAAFENTADDSSVMTDAQAELADLKDQGIKAKIGPAF